ncbi:MAG TPA: hypothetical protein VKV15_01170 [Bryobacteraceae bacterium]|nr:hypothetical protein [Bryobacteraceae bacterium]
MDEVVEIGTNYAHLIYQDLVVAVRVGVVLGSFFGVMDGLKVVPMGYMSMMPGFLMIACLMVFRGGAMMARRVFMMVGGLLMMICAFLRHWVFALFQR